MKHAGARFPYRLPPPSGVIENGISVLGSFFRFIGAGLDEMGAMVQGSAADRSELHVLFFAADPRSPALHAVRPNLAWAPAKLDPASPPTKGQVAAVPPMGRIMKIKEIVVPRKGEDVFIAPNANVLGDVKLGSRSSIWYGAVLRGEQLSLFSRIALSLSHEWAYAQAT